MWEEGECGNAKKRQDDPGVRHPQQGLLPLHVLSLTESQPVRYFTLSALANNDFDSLELLEFGVSSGRHRATQGSHEIHRAVCNT